MSDKIKIKKVILDPVMIAKGGAKLIDKDAIKLLKNELIKKVTLITPNIPEAEILTNTIIKTKEDMIFAASLLIELGAKNVFIKGGHLDSKVVQDVFVNKKEILIIENSRIFHTYIIFYPVFYRIFGHYSTMCITYFM